MMVLTIHDGKGQKDRTVPLPDSIKAELQEHMKSLAVLHEQDCQAGYDGVFLYGLLEKKYKNAARELIWQWFFPARDLTMVPESNERRRYHVHESSPEGHATSSAKGSYPQAYKRAYPSAQFRLPSPAKQLRHSHHPGIAWS